MIAKPNHLSKLILDILTGGSHQLSGVHNSSTSVHSLVASVTQWGDSLGRQLEDITAVLEPCLRQSILMSLLPSRAFDPTYVGPIDDVIEEHLAALGVTSDTWIQRTAVLRNAGRSDCHNEHECAHHGEQEMSEQCQVCGSSISSDKTAGRIDISGDTAEVVILRVCGTCIGKVYHLLKAMGWEL